MELQVSQVIIAPLLYNPRGRVLIEVRIRSVNAPFLYNLMSRIVMEHQVSQVISSPHFYNQRGRVLIGLQVGKVIKAPLLRKLIGKVLIELLESQGFILARNTSTQPKILIFFSLP
jgi:hypothetical protein